jgi:hypothetical protein
MFQPKVTHNVKTSLENFRNRWKVTAATENNQTEIQDMFLNAIKLCNEFTDPEDRVFTAQELYDTHIIGANCRSSVMS